MTIFMFNANLIRETGTIKLFTSSAVNLFPIEPESTSPLLVNNLISVVPYDFSCISHFILIFLLSFTLLTPSQLLTTIPLCSHTNIKKNI